MHQISAQNQNTFACVRARSLTQQTDNPTIRRRGSAETANEDRSQTAVIAFPSPLAFPSLVVAHLCAWVSQNSGILCLLSVVFQMFPEFSIIPLNNTQYRVSSRSRTTGKPDNCVSVCACVHVFVLSFCRSFVVCLKVANIRISFLACRTETTHCQLNNLKYAQLVLYVTLLVPWLNLRRGVVASSLTTRALCNKLCVYVVVCVCVCIV